MSTIKQQARYAVWKAVRDGALVPGPCERCGKPNGHAHHEDYSKPLDVVWLCHRCHMRRHVEIDRANGMHIGGPRITFSVSRELLDAIDAQRLIPTGGTERGRAEVVRDALTLGLPKLLATLQQERRTNG